MSIKTRARRVEAATPNWERVVSRLKTLALRILKAPFNKRNLKRTLAILGNLIIVATFITRDVLRDDTKEEWGALRNAQLVSLARADSSALMTATVKLSDQMLHFVNRYDVLQLKQQPDNYKMRKFAIDMSDLNLATDNMILENVEALLHDIKDGDLLPEREEFHKLKGVSDTLSGKLQGFINTENEPGHVNVSTDPFFLEPFRFMEELGSDILYKDVGNLRLRCFSRSEELSKLLEKRYKTINIVFYILFSIGVVLNLISIFVGNQVVVEGA